MLSVCVFCGASAGDRPAWGESADAVGQLLAERGCRIVYGGGSTGMMGRLADSALAAGGQVVGVIPEHLATVELMHTRATEMIVTKDMHERKAQMHRLGDAFLVLPGGIGSMEELFEVMTWRQLRLHDCQIAILNQDGFYDGLVQLLERMVTCGFLRDHHRQLLESLSTVDEVAAWLDRLMAAPAV